MPPHLVLAAFGFAGVCALSSVIWHMQWPNGIHQSIISFQNSSGSISNSDLEMAGMLLHYLAPEHLAIFQHIHMAAWCDNTPIVSWTNKLSASSSPVAGCLTHALAMQIHINEASPLTSLSTASVDNQMANIASRTFHHNTATPNAFAIFSNDDFLHLFNSTFPLQDNSWHNFHLIYSRVTFLVFSELRGKNHKERQRY